MRRTTALNYGYVWDYQIGQLVEVDMLRQGYGWVPATIMGFEQDSVVVLLRNFSRVYTVPLGRIREK